MLGGPKLHTLLALGSALGLAACAGGGASSGASTVTAAEEQSVRPGVNARYFEEGAVEKWTGVLEGESREVVRQRREILDALSLQPGMTVADVGAGTGLFTLEIAKAVGPQGRVDAVDIVPEFLTRIRALAAEHGLQNVNAVLGAEKDVKLPEGSVQLAFLCNVYHHLEYPHTYMQTVLRALAPGGSLVLIDFERVEGVTSPRMLKHVRAAKATVIREVEQTGFRLVQAKKGFMQENYFLIFERSARPEAVRGK